MKFYFLLSLVFSAGGSSASEPAVKLSNSGICHSIQSSSYSRTKNFKPFASVKKCLQAGGRLPKGQKAPKASESLKGGYERDLFGSGWDDEDGDCQNSRAEKLISTSIHEVEFSDSRGCTVVRGKWLSEYSLRYISEASKIDIDHVVPLKWAWEHGASSWSASVREAFANDPVNLLPVEASLNRSKGAKGPDEWLPPSSVCSYVGRFLDIVEVYDLSLSQQERNKFSSLVRAHCD